MTIHQARDVEALFLAFLAENPDLGRIELLVCDMHGILRGK